MRCKETEFFGLPAGDDNLEEAQQAAEELPVDFDSFGFLVRLCLRQVGMLGSLKSLSRSLTLDLSLSSRRRFLFGDGIMNAVDDGDHEGCVYSAGDLCAVFEVESGQFGEDLFDAPFGR